MRKVLLALSLVTALGAGVLAPATPAFAATQLLCSQSTNGGSLVNGVCVLPNATQGQSYEAFILTDDGTVDTFSITSGSLPPGLSMPSRYGTAGTIVSGTPTTQGTWTFTVKCVNTARQSTYQTYQITVGVPAPLTITNQTPVTSGTVGVSYAQNWFLSGGLAPYTWSLAAGQFPPGLALRSTNGTQDANNQLAGTPTTAGTYLFTMQVNDSSGQVATKDFSLTIN